jgi:hypothetical protein
VLASGPSLTQQDVEAVRAAGVPVVVTNLTMAMAPWADIAFGWDSRFWRTVATRTPEVLEAFKGRILTAAHVVNEIDVETVRTASWFRHDMQNGNSGAGAILLAASAGAKRIVLLGFDCQATGGKTHWHGDHKFGLSNARSIAVWPKYFQQTAKAAGRIGCEVVNASRVSVLTCFVRSSLEAELDLLLSHAVP